MSEKNYHIVVGEALSILIDGLSPFVEEVCAKSLPPSVSWTEVLRRKDAAAGRQMGMYKARDLSLMLRAMTERLGEYGFPFNRQLSRLGQSYASELRDVRNRWAHNETFSAAEAYRAIDSIELLLRAANAPGGAIEAARLKLTVSPLPAAEPTSEGQPRPASGRTPPMAQRPDKQTVPATRFAPAPTHETITLPAASTAAIRLEIKAISDLSYPMAHCRIPVVDQVTIDGVTEDLRGAVLRVDVVSATGSHGGPRELHVDLAAGKPTILRDVDLALDPASMLTVDDQRPGRIEAVLHDAAGEVIAKGFNEVNILAANQWKATPLHLGLEMLAAHIQPNASAISGLMPDVSDRLNAATGRSAIDGYQSESPERADAIAQAVYDAMRARDIRYAEPPASWGLDGQKIRTPHEVLDDRLGTCLDTAVTMAAALEQAGINTTLWVLKGHALLGYWRVDAALPAISTTEVIDVANLVDLGQIRLVETTMLAGGDDSSPFPDAVGAGRRHLGDDLSNVFGVTDIRQARLSRIYPLPSRTLSPDGSVVVTEYTPAEGPAIAPYQRSDSSATVSHQTDSVPLRVAKWKNALLDLSLRNKLINYTDRAGYRVEIPGPALGRFEDAVNDNARITLLASDAVKEIDVARGIRYGRDLPERERELLLAEKNSAYIDITGAAYKTKLRYLAAKAKTIVEETGSNNLYLTFGMLNWRFDDRELRSPLVLVPVTLSTANRGERYTLALDETGASTPNYCLVEKLRVSFGLEVPDLKEPTHDASGIDLAATFNAVRRAITRAGLHFRVEETTHLAILQFAKFPLWKDLDNSWKALSSNSLVRHLIDSPDKPFTDPVAGSTEVDLDRLGDEMPVSADSSQLQAIAQAAAGRTFVLEGPPGTGKSQTITNLLAHAMAAGRRVLFVAEKRAALDVVKKRLQAVGLGELSLDLHDKSSRPAAVREQIRAALDLSVSADTDSLRTQTEAAESSRNALARYARRLHEENAARMSLYSARTAELAADQDVAPIEVPKELVAGGPSETLHALQQVMRKLPEVADLAQPSIDHPWGFIDSPPAESEVAEIHRCAVEFDSALAAGVECGLTIDSLGRCGLLAGFDSWVKLCGAPRHPLSALDTLHEGAWAQELASLDADLHTLTQRTPEWRSVASVDAVDLDIPAIHSAAVAADESKLFGRKKRRRAVLEQLSDVLVVDPKTIDLKTLTSLVTGILEAHAAVAGLRGRVARIPATVIGEPWNPLVPEHTAKVRQQLGWLRWTAALLSAQPNDPHIDDLRSYYANQPVGAFASQLARIPSAWSALTKTTETSSERQNEWAQPQSFIVHWWAMRSARRLDDTASIEHWAALLHLIEPLKPAGMSAVRTAILNGEIDPDDASLAFARGIAVASVAERRDATALGSFNAEAHDKTVERYTKSLRAIRGELPRAIPAALLHKRRFDANSASGQIGGLRRQLDRRRGGMSVRGLIEHYGELITQIMPCTMMSPDSVARFFPARPDLFDIVVFDEASQIRVADAIGAMGRSRSVVVVGDSKQMPPTSFAEANANVDDADDTDQEFFLDEESILTECVHAQLPQQWLSWHYRSQDEALIAFSNQHYYNRRLASFPAPRSGGASDAGGQGISLIRVNGTFERSGKGKTLRTNRVEADAIVDDVARRFEQSPDAVPSLGIITFNAQQRDLIDNLLRDSADERVVRALDEPDGLFVKNLENVQGDERDTILFSVAFSAKEKGVVPLNFGPLSRPGGERRLNVAITRARREVVLYASFDAEDLRAEETSQIGTKHLKAYLEMAARGVDDVADSMRRTPVIDRHRDDIAAALRDAGLVVTTDLGLSDFRVDLVLGDPTEPERQLVAVLLDGQSWRARRTVADRDALPVDVLRDLMHWPAIERVWLPEWLRRPEHVVAQLKESVDVARQRVLSGNFRAETTAPVPSPAPPRQATPLLRASQPAKPATAAAQSHPMVQVYHEWKPGRLGDVTVLDDLPIAYAKSRVYDAIISAMAAEAPIHPRRLTKLVAAAFNLTRLNENRHRSIEYVVPVDYRRPTGEGFYWPVGVEPEDWRIVRRPPEGTSRQLDHVSLIEIGNAMIVVAEQTGGIETYDLKREALNLLGGRRVTQQIEARLNDALNKALERKVLHQNGSGLITSAVLHLSGAAESAQT
ncbi:DUF4011 domain-containing protein [Mycobacterium intracellulare]|uniref:DUF4011 domain-containing protein n=1 Tax=Mycobacterium intracellulare TaxID=1767 RepID=UPI000BAC25E0|nr:DUF4011 domain-containing protein [Mycobacterium intracellulare]ASX00237.1 DNA helicase [Mycobacterium intracellulare subsp. chimaera]PBA63055.1 DNA helicase [Mycobacterium intracellulare subsp. chimaera]